MEAHLEGGAGGRRRGGCEVGGARGWGGGKEGGDGMVWFEGSVFVCFFLYVMFGLRGNVPYLPM